MDADEEIRDQFFCGDAIDLMARRIPDDSVDLIVTDPPYGIAGDTLHKHYNRDESLVVDGYVEIPAAEYADFTGSWIREASRVLRPGGSIFIVSGYSNLRHILNSLSDVALEEVNHVIWKFNFGVATRRKFVSSHYHILYYYKPGGRRVFNTFSRYGSRLRDEHGRSIQYADLEDVWAINKEYKPGKEKNKNELPTALLVKMIQYCSNEEDLVLDLFLGGFSTAVVAKGLNRFSCGMEINKNAFNRGHRKWRSAERGFLLDSVPTGVDDRPQNAGAPLDAQARIEIIEFVSKMRGLGNTKAQAINAAMNKFHRGYWSISKLLKSSESPVAGSLFDD